ncbi:MAG: CRTAC1 family protein [Planctomycetes bacterium]|nr:CRTAC1 family protein [Planctomycetota bacterium]
MQILSIRTISLSLACFLCHCAEPPPPPPIAIPDVIASDPWFVDEAKERGVEFSWKSGAKGKHHMPEIIGGGVAMIDIDGDDDLDLYFVQGGSMFAVTEDINANQLFINKNGYFSNTTEFAGAGDTGYGMGVSVGDYDNDGDPDLYVTNFGPDTLLQNNGNGTFTDATTAAGFSIDAWTTGSVFFDYDNDGDLDLFVMRYLHWDQNKESDCGVLFFGKHDYCSPVVYNSPLPDILYNNNGDGTFTDVSKKSGIATAVGYGLGIGVDDFNGDGLEDVFVANDMSEHHLWINQGDGTFKNEAEVRGCAIDGSGNKKAGMGTEIFDADQDGDPDILVVNMENQSDSLFLNDGDGYFVDATGATGLVGLSRLHTRFGVLREDFDNDGNSDLYVANGRISRLFEPVVKDVYAEQNLLFSGDSNGIMSRTSHQGGTQITPLHTSRGAATGDFDGDGRLDIVVVNRDAPAYVLHNITEKKNAVELDLRNTHGSPAIGTIVTFHLGDQQHRHRVRSSRSYLSAMSPIIHVGLGDYKNITDITVNWASGKTTTIPSIQQGKIVIKEPTK